jgi:predicted peptidase
MKRLFSFIFFLVLSCTTPKQTMLASNKLEADAPPMPRAVQLKEEPSKAPAALPPTTAKPKFTAKEISAVKTSEFKALTFKSQQTNLKMPYRLFTPKGYDPSRPYALILYLHGAGDRGDDNEQQFSKLTMWMARTKNQRETPAFILAPQCPSRMQWVNTPWAKGSYSIEQTPLSEPMKAALEILAAVQAEYNIDPDRILVTGVSMGGFGAWDLVTRFPQKFAAVMPVCGAGDPSKASTIAHVPAWIFHGEKDHTVPTKGARELVKALKDAGASPIYVEYKGQEHGIWDDAYKDEKALAWFFSQKRGATPPPRP